MESVYRVMCDMKVPMALEDKTIIRPAMTYVSECWDEKKKYEEKN